LAAVDRPNSIPWPPMLLAGALLGTAVLERAAPTSLGVPAALGWLLVVAALALDVSAMTTMARAQTNILPNRPATSLVTTGPFAWSRNPIYVGNVLLILGLGIAFDSSWSFAAALADALLTHRLAVVREERHLEAKFGSAWRRYAARVPRWVGLPAKD
jgi:protein-S-isoprenylcysteine O-methyltransferase Ste14